MTQSNVLYCESWDATLHFPDKDVCEMKCTLTISKTKEGYERKIVTSHVDTPEAVGDTSRGPIPFRNLDECVEEALCWMHNDKLGMGSFNLGAGVSVEEVIRRFTGVTKEEARRLSWDEIYPMIDNEMVNQLCNRQQPDKETWNRLVERVNKNVAYDLHRAYEYCSAKLAE